MSIVQWIRHHVVSRVCQVPPESIVRWIWHSVIKWVCQVPSESIMWWIWHRIIMRLLWFNLFYMSLILIKRPVHKHLYLFYINDRFSKICHCIVCNIALWSLLIVVYSRGGWLACMFKVETWCKHRNAIILATLPEPVLLKRPCSDVADLFGVDLQVTEKFSVDFQICSILEFHWGFYPLQCIIIYPAFVEHL